VRSSRGGVTILSMIFPVVPLLFIVVGALMWTLAPAKTPKLIETGKWMLIIGLFVFCFVNGTTWKATVHI